MRQADLEEDWRGKAGVNEWWDQILEAKDAEAQGMGVEWLERPRRRKGSREHCESLRREGRILTLVLVRLALALARRWGFTASAIDTAETRSPFVFIKTLRFTQPGQFRPPGCHMI